jgi:hypothetical protein
LLSAARRTSPSKSSGGLLEEWWTHTLHVICVFADCAVDGVVVRCELLTSDASLASAGEISTSTNLDENKVPPSVKNVFDTGRNVYDFFGGNDFVVALHVSVIELVEPEAVFFLTEDVQVVDAAHVLDVAFSS